MSISFLKAQDTLMVIHKIHLEGNKVTKDNIIYREITFREGDTIGKNIFQEQLINSRQNLMNTSLFNFVDVIDTSIVYKGVTLVEVKFKVLERWYIWPLPIFELAERNLSVWLQDMDFNRVNYGLFLDWDNFRGRRERLKILLQFGYDEKIGFSYSIPYIDKKQTVGLDFGFNQTKNHEVSYATVDNEVQRIRLKDEYAHRAYDAFVGVFNRPDIYQSHYFETSYNDHIYHDTVFQLNPEFYLGEGSRAQYFKLSYTFKNDHRDFKPYPLKGYYFDLQIEKLGLGFFHESKINIYNAKINYRKYWTFNKRMFFASGVTLRVGNKGDHPYFLNYGMGYGREFVRGYEYYVVDGQNFGILKTDFKFAIVPQRVSVLKFIPTEKFNKIPWAVYLSLFNDFGYVSGDAANGNDLQNTIMWGYGAGINLVTYYDIVWRIEYSFNQKGEGGFFVHFMASI
jgi:outer membrane protein assembly factor BamA